MPCIPPGTLHVNFSSGHLHHHHHHCFFNPISNVKILIAGLSIDCFLTPVYSCCLHTDIRQNLPRARLSFIIGLWHAQEDLVALEWKVELCLRLCFFSIGVRSLSRTQHWPFDSSLFICGATTILGSTVGGLHVMAKAPGGEHFLIFLSLSLSCYWHTWIIQ